MQDADQQVETGGCFISVTVKVEINTDKTRWENDREILQQCKMVLTKWDNIN